jgi:hypothetical protein
MARRKGPFDAVQFTRESAERIAGVVRQAELTPPAASPLTFDKRFAERHPKQVRAATFSGAWPTGSSKIVTFKYAPTATVNAFNLSWPITLTAYSNEDCIVGKEGTNWWLVVPKLEARTAVFVTQTEASTYCSSTASQIVVTGVTTSGITITYLTDVSVTAALDTASCAIQIGVTKTTASEDLVKAITHTTQTVTIVTSTKTAIMVLATTPSSFLRLRVP